MNYIGKIYRAMPIKNILKKAGWIIPTPFFYGKTFRKYYSLLNKSQWWTKEQLETYQLKKLKMLIEYAYQKVPYYKHIFKKHNITPEDIGSLNDIERMPFLTKEDVRAHFKELFSIDYLKMKPRKRTTGGSSGRYLEVMTSEYTEDIRKAAVWRFRNWAGYRFIDRCLTFSRPHETPAGQKLFYENSKEKQINFNIEKFNQEILVGIVDKIQEFRPKVLECYPSRLFILCKYLEKHNVNLPSVKIAITTSELIYPWLRSFIEEKLHCSLYDYYGQIEFVCTAGQCENKNYHLAEEVGICEIIKSDGRQSRTGEVGEIVGTSLENYVMPLIRYKTADLAAVDDRICACGRKLSVLKQIIGRTQNIIVSPQWVKTFPARAFHFHLLEGIDDLQIVQERADALLVKVVVNNSYSLKTEAMLIDMLQKGYEYPFKITVQPVQKIPRTPLDKHNLVISKIPITF